MTAAAPPSVLVIAIGEAHQLLHVLGTALELQKAGVTTHLLVSTHWHEQIVAAHAPELSGALRRAPLMYTDRPLHVCPPRAPNLVLARNMIAGYGAVVSPERTSTLLKTLLGKRCPKLVHIPHGAGDRAKGYDRRISAFDLILVAGQKDYDAFIARGLATAQNCHVIGYCKFDVLGGPAPRFFANDNPVVLYNPHFDEKLSSWLPFGEALVSAFSRMPEFNFIIAPHVRLHGKSRRLFDRLAAGPAHANLRFDGGSLHSINMDYTRSAAIYTGDVSSQVYEFLQAPKPCVFASAHGAVWQGDPHYRHWQFGEVGTSPEAVVALIRAAFADHAKYRAVQEAGFNAAIALSDPSASERAAGLIQSFLTR